MRTKEEIIKYHRDYYRKNKKLWYENWKKNKKKIYARKRKHYAMNPETRKRAVEKGRRWRKEHPVKALAQRLAAFQISVRDYWKLVKKQNGRCAICGKKNSEKRYRRLMLDHDHKCCPRRGSCGKCVRGLLCSSCNLAIGNFKDDLQLLKRAVEYLEGFQSCR